MSHWENKVPGANFMQWHQFFYRKIESNSSKIYAFQSMASRKTAWFHHNKKKCKSWTNQKLQQCANFSLKRWFPRRVALCERSDSKWNKIRNNKHNSWYEARRQLNVLYFILFFFFVHCNSAPVAVYLFDFLYLYL